MAVRKYQFFVGALAGVGVAVAAAAGVGVRMPTAAADTHGRLMLASTSPVFAPAPGAPQSFADIFEKVSPAVVSINVTSHIPVSQQPNIPGLKGFPFNIVPPNGQGGDDGDDGDDNGSGGSPAPRGQKALSAGSGFFISPDGYIVTNNHVVENADDIKVVMKDGSTLKATVVGRDEGTDLAVIKVEGHNFAYVDFENNARPRVGDWVLAVGNPFSLGSTATAGIVSAYGRDIGETFVDYIQIDAPINRGNSGGPTFDVYGRVIGVNTAIFSPSGGSVGIGFAIPADVADNITKQLIAGGKITRGYLGATIQGVTQETADSLGLKEKRGALVAELVPGGPAQKAGLQQGDLVLEVNGHKVKDQTDLTRQVAASHTGDNLNLTVLRGGKQIAVTVKSGVRPSQAELDKQQQGAQDDEAPTTPGGPSIKPDALGLSVGPLDDAARKRYMLPNDISGAVVEGVASSSDAGKKAIKRGDVLVRAGDRSVSSPADVAAAIDSAKKAGRTSILVFIYREGRQIGVPLKFDGAPDKEKSGKSDK